ncbi:D-2-hydroxyacid dehydrogenase [Pontibacillus salicampi]|uniref:D-2-hydroxyacid dehydrogenase n=1 Tax=Pontibacillus salicampi TaxID=1449801 RepID=A0ABV6LHW6_9BACI
MYIVTSCKIRRDLREHLVTSYPDITFQFCESMEEAKPYLPKAEILFTYGEDVETTHVEQAKKLQWIMVLSAGVDKLPFEAIEQEGITVTNVKGIHSIPMSEYAISMLLQVNRNEKTLIENEKLRKWEKFLPITEIHGKTMVVVGAGAIGQEVARLAKAFRMKTVGISNSGRDKEHFDEVYQKDQLDYILPEADFVVAVLPSTPETKGFFTRSHFEHMKDSAIFLNMGRGDAVGDDLMLDVMEDELIEHAILDVFEQEPLPEAHPFWGMPNVTVTPHLSGLSPEYQPRALEVFERNLPVYRNGGEDFVNRIDPGKGY